MRIERSEPIQAAFELVRRVCDSFSLPLGRTKGNKSAIRLRGESSRRRLDSLFTLL